MKSPVYILEGTWWSKREVPLILPYFEALAASHRDIVLSHRTIRSAEDVAYYVRKLSAEEHAFVYFACHGSKRGGLIPTDKRSPITPEQLHTALSQHKRNAIGFLHFGCCNIVRANERRATLEPLLEASGARWVSGYTKDVDWLPSTLLDLALVQECFVQFYYRHSMPGPKLRAPARQFMESYNQLARSLGFSGLARSTNGHPHELFPERLHGG